MENSRKLLLDKPIWHAAAMSVLGTDRVRDRWVLVQSSTYGQAEETSGPWTEPKPTPSPRKKTEEQLFLQIKPGERGRQ